MASSSQLQQTGSTAAIPKRILATRALKEKGERVRSRQWMYLGPVAAAPLAHIAVTAYKSAKTPTQRKWILIGGIIGSTVATVGMRLYLMKHAGYAGAPSSGHMASARTLNVTTEERAKIENPSYWDIAKEMVKGFG